MSRMETKGSVSAESDCTQPGHLQSRRAEFGPDGSHPAWRAGATLDAVRKVALSCSLCPLAALGRSQVVFGAGASNADLMFVGEGPGEREDQQGHPFVGRSGKLLTQLIDEIGLSRDEVYIANVVKCRPPGNRDPAPLEIATCAPWLDRQLELIRPKVIVTLGNFSTKLLLETTVGITKLRGLEVSFVRAGLHATLIPTLHPSAVLRTGGKGLAEARADFVTVQRKLAEAQGG